MVAGDPERDHYECHLQPLKQHALEGEHEARPVDAVGFHLLHLIERAQGTASKTVGADAQETLTEPVQTEHQEQGADHEAQELDRDGAESTDGCGRWPRQRPVRDCRGPLRAIVP